MTDKPAFNFGAPASTSSSTTQSLFGTLGNPAGSGTTFGSTPSTGATTGFSFDRFGQTPPATSAEQTKPLFGATSDNRTSNLFGQMGNSGGTGTTFGFGQKPDENQ